MRYASCRGLFSSLLVGLSLLGCVQRADTYTRLQDPNNPPLQTSKKILTQSQTITLEAADRIARFRRLAEAARTTQPSVDEVAAPPRSVPGVDIPVPVVRLVFPERHFFDFDKAMPRAEALPVIDLIAENMKRDVPDAAVTVLGHSDAIGSDAYNIALSERRASHIFAALIARGVNPNQLSTVGIGSAQPIAPNVTEEGRARNRRVEFLISGSEQANLSVVENRTIDVNFLRVRQDGVAPKPVTSVQVLKPTRPPEQSEAILGPTGMLTLRSRASP